MLRRAYIVSLIFSYAIFVTSSIPLIVMIGINLFVLILQGYWIYPYCWFARHEVKNSGPQASTVFVL